MAATVKNIVYSGGSNGNPSYPTTDITTIKFRTDDNPANTDNSAPIKKPSSGYNYSYWVHVLLDISGTFTQITNIKLYPSGTLNWALGTGGGINVGFSANNNGYGIPSANYRVATGTPGETGLELNTTNHTGIAYVSSLYAYSSTNMLTVDSNTYTSATKTKAVVLQAKVASDATAGAYSNEGYYWQWDEI